MFPQFNVEGWKVNNWDLSKYELVNWKAVFTHKIYVLIFLFLFLNRPEDGSGKKHGIGSPDGDSSSGESQDDKGPIIDQTSFQVWLLITLSNVNPIIEWIQWVLKKS